MFGISNGGYLTRWQIENRQRLYDGGLDWEGTLLRDVGRTPSRFWIARGSSPNCFVSRPSRGKSALSPASTSSRTR